MKSHRETSNAGILRYADLPGNPAVESIYYQPPGDGVHECVIVEFVGGPKAYARFFTGSRPYRIEWGWALHKTAVKVWPA